MLVHVGLFPALNWWLMTYWLVPCLPRSQGAELTATGAYLRRPGCFLPGNQSPEATRTPTDTLVLHAGNSDAVTVEDQLEKTKLVHKEIFRRGKNLINIVESFVTWFVEHFPHGQRVRLWLAQGQLTPNFMKSFIVLPLFFLCLCLFCC